MAILAGDYLFAQSSWGLAQLDNLEVIKLISQVIADFANGEISQALRLFDTSVSMAAYMDKSYYKTASLIAASCRGAAVFSEVRGRFFCRAGCVVCVLFYRMVLCVERNTSRCVQTGQVLVCPAASALS